MTTSQNRYARSAWLHCLSVLVACLALVLLTAPDGSQADGTLDNAPSFAKLQARTLMEHGKGLDKGTFDIYQIHFPNLPTAWVWVEDDTIDGNGVEYWAVHGAFIPPGPANPALDLSYEYAAGQNHLTLQEFLDYIVQNNPHVNDASELMVSRKQASQVP